MTDLFNRLGSIGILLIAGALIVGGLTGAAVAHHYETLSAVPAASQQQGDNRDSEKGSNAQNAENSDEPDAKPVPKHKAKTKPAPKKAKPKPSASPSPKPSGSPEPDQVNNN